MPKKKKDSGPPTLESIEDTLVEELGQVGRMLKQVTEQQKMGMDAADPIRLLLVKVFARLLRMGEKIDEAYGGQAFNYHYAGMAPINLWRFESFVGAHNRVHRLLYRAMTMWLMSAGMRWSCANNTRALAHCHARGRRRGRRRARRRP
jgi:hypothetical protein